MNYKRVIRFQYYQIKSIKAHDKNAKYRIFNFAKWIKALNDHEMIRTAIDFNEAKARIELSKFNDEYKVWGLKIFKLRNTNIPSKAKEKEEAEVIQLGKDEYLGEDLFLIYDQQNGIAMIQQNRMSLGISRLEEFFIDTFNRYVNKDEEIEVTIDPILDIDSKKKINRSMYKYLEISFANINEFVANDDRKSLGSLMSSFKLFQGVNGAVKISLGRSGLSTLKRSEVKNLLREVYDPGNKRYIRTAKLKIQEEDDSDVEIVDLFSDICAEFLEFTIDSTKGLTYDTTVSIISNKYKNRKTELEKLIGKRK